MGKQMTPEGADRVNAAIKELWAVAEEEGLSVLSNEDQSDDDDHTPQVVITLEGRWPADEQTWTFVGHWDNDRIVVEYVLDGEVEDSREDTGFWEQGLWAAAASGRTQDEAKARAIAEYENNNDEEGTA